VIVDLYQNLIIKIYLNLIIKFIFVNKMMICLKKIFFLLFFLVFLIFKLSNVTQGCLSHFFKSSKEVLLRL
jgi:hypothetical protein